MGQATAASWGSTVFVSAQENYLQQYSITGELLKTYSNIYYPAGLASDLAGNLLVSLFYERQVVVLYPGGRTATISVPNATSVAVCPNGRLYVSQLEGYPNTLIFDELLGKQTGAIYDPEVRYGGYVQCDAHSNVFENYTDKNYDVQFVEYVDGKIPAINIPIKLSYTTGFRFDRSGHIVVANGAEVQFYHVGRNTPFRRIKGFNETSDLSLNKDETTLWVCDYGANQVVSVDMATRKKTLVISGLTMPTNVAVFPTDQFSSPDVGFIR